MKEYQFQATYKVYQLEELSDEVQYLIKLAKKATNNSYSPYSNFSVGAAVYLANGHYILGANQENAAYPAGLCAERTAIFAAQVQYPQQPIVAIAIAAQNSQGFTQQPITPCGSCRQVMLEVEQRYNRSLKIYLYGTKYIYAIETVKDILPLQFISDLME